MSSFPLQFVYFAPANIKITLGLDSGTITSIIWGDGSSNLNPSPPYQHTYSNNGIYTVSVEGNVTNLSGSISFDVINSQQYLSACISFGEIGLTNLTDAFYAAINLTVVPSSLPTLSTIINMTDMFGEATSFNGSLNNWNVSNVTNMAAMFYGVSSFNQPLNDWNVSNVTNMDLMFFGASSFNQPLNDWNVSNVTSMTDMFFGLTSFNQPLNNWNVSNVTNMTNMFFGLTSFNQSLNDWNVSNVTSMNNIFGNATSFNQPLNNWNISNVTNMDNIFGNATSFNQPLNNWNVSNVISMDNMFGNATSFNQPLNNWNISNVTSMNNIFGNATSFNQPLNNWNVSNVISMDNMFSGATSFNQPLNNWNVSNVTSMTSMLDYTNLSIDNYNSTLNGWAKLSLKPDVSLGAFGLVYSPAGLSARNFLTSQYNWTITGDIFLQSDIVILNKPFNLTNFNYSLNQNNTYQLFDTSNNPISQIVTFDGTNPLNFFNVIVKSYGLVSIILKDITDPQNIYTLATFHINVLQFPPLLTPLPFRPSLQPSSNLGMYNRYRGASSVGSRPKYGGASRMYSYAHAQNQQDQVIDLFIASIFGIRK
uniref:PKD domain-containing protein n=1 Tax=viral metagenome TaxID=1070528 RepID=A0A6C0AQT1_9ZZZZ